MGVLNIVGNHYFQANTRTTYITCTRFWVFNCVHIQNYFEEVWWASDLKSFANERPLVVQKFVRARILIFFVRETRKWNFPIFTFFSFFSTRTKKKKWIRVAKRGGWGRDQKTRVCSLIFVSFMCKFYYNYKLTYV